MEHDTLSCDDLQLISVYFRYRRKLPPEVVAYGDISGCTEGALLERLGTCTRREAQAILEELEAVLLEEEFAPPQKVHSPRGLA